MIPILMLRFLIQGSTRVVLVLYIFRKTPTACPNLVLEDTTDAPTFGQPHYLQIFTPFSLIFQPRKDKKILSRVINKNFI